MCYSISSLIPIKSCGFMVRELISSNFQMIIFHLGVRNLFLPSGESKILCKRLLAKFMPWEDESSSNVVEVKNRIEEES